jgi:hypothetical protein
MNEEYKSLVKKIDEMLAIREIDEFLDKIEKKKKSKKGELKEEKELKKIKKEIQEKEKEKCRDRLESKKSNNLSCRVSIGTNIKEEVFELPKILEKEVFELYECEEFCTEKQKKMIKINWKKVLKPA